MVSVGAHLREVRTRRGVSLDEIARLTRVAPRYLTALENDAFSELPAPVFVRGFVRAYCQALGEPPEEALAIYDAREGRAPQASARPPAATRSFPAEPRGRGTVAVSFILLVILGMALFSVTLVIRPGDRHERLTADVRPEPPAAGSPGEPAPPVPAIGATPPPVSVPPRAVARPQAPPAPAPPVRTGAPATPPGSVAPPPAETSPTRRPAPDIEGVVGGVSSPYRLIARTTESTWIRVRMGDGRSSDETVPPGEVREWVSDRPFTLTVGNAGGVSLELNGRALPPLGPRGAVIPRLVLPPESR
jgi:cytoskeleton protein RodZ